MAADVERYLRQAAGWGAVENETKHAIDRILQTEFVDQAEVARQIADSRPTVMAHLEAVRGYAPGTPAVRAVHARYVGAWERLLAAYANVDAGLASAQYERLSAGRVGLLAWQQGLVEVARDLRQLAAESGAPLEAAGGSARR